MYFNSHISTFGYENEGYGNELGMIECIICMIDAHTKIDGKFIKMSRNMVPATLKYVYFEDDD